MPYTIKKDLTSTDEQYSPSSYRAFTLPENL